MKAPTSLFFKEVVIFIFFFLLFFSAHSFSDGFTSGDDPYYHAKHALLMEQSGNFKLIEPWLEFHFFNYAPTDPWWGFHLIMALFIHWFGLILGIKIFASLLASLTFLIFYLILNNLNIKYPAVWTFLLFFSSPIFTYRLFLERPHLLSIIFLPVTLWLLIKQKYFWLFLTALFYALFYQLAPLIILPALIFSAVAAYFTGRFNLKPLLAAVGGILVGIIIHPAGLNYLYVIFISFFKIFFLKFSGIDLNIGNELQLIGFSDFVRGNFLALLFYILAAVRFLFLKMIGKNSVVSNFLFFCASFWLLVTLLVPRGVEYWLPVNFIFAAVMFSNFPASEEFKQTKNWLADKINFKAVGFFLISALVLIVFYNLSDVFFNLYYNDTAKLGANYEQANDWLKKNTSISSVVFYNNWSMWPMMFYYNNHNHYILGMDPTFLYEYDHELFWLWKNISYYGLYCARPELCLEISPRDNGKLIKAAFKEKFQANYVLLTNNQEQPLAKFLRSDKKNFLRVFENEKALIYELR